MGGEIIYTWDRIKESLPYRPEIFAYQHRITSREERLSANSPAQNKVNYIYDHANVNSRKTTTKLEGQTAFSIDETFDIYGNLTQVISQSSQTNNKYYITKNIQYIFTPEGNWLPSQITAQIRETSASNPSTIVETYEYNSQQQPTAHGRTNLDTGVVETIETWEYSEEAPYIMTEHFQKRGEDDWVGVSNDLTEDYMEVATSYAASNNDAGDVRRHEATEYEYDDITGEVISITAHGVTQEFEHTYAQTSTTNLNSTALTVDIQILNVDGIVDSSGMIDGVTITQQQQYDWLGGLIEETDGNDNVTSHEYDLHGRETKTVYPDATYITAQYNDTANEVIITDEEGRKQKYTFDTLGRASDVYIYKNSTWVKTHGNTYDNQSRLTKTQVFEDNGTTEKARMEYTYYADGELASEIAYQGSIILSKKEYTNALYNDIETSRKTAKVYSTTSQSATLNQYSDRNGFVIKDEIVADNTPISQTYENDFLGNVVSTKDFRANRPSVNYTTASYTYDYANRLIKTTTPSGITSIEYDDYGRKNAEIDAMEVETTYSYNEAGLVTQISKPIDDYTTALTKKYYNANGNLAREDIYTTDTEFNTTKYFYDERNRLTDVVTNPSGNAEEVVKYLYDVSGNMTQMVQGLTSKDDAINSAVHNITTYTYDSLGNCISVTDPMGMSTTYTYNNLGMMLTETDKNNVTKTLTYDGLGRITKVAAGNQNIQYTYDLLGNVTKMVDNAGTTTYTYNTKGQMLAETRDGITKTYTYNENGARTSFDVSGISELFTTYAYDNSNRLSQVDTNGDRTIYTYNANNMLENEATLNGMAVIKEAGFDYNEGGLLIEQINKIGTTELASYTRTYFADGNVATANDNGTAKDYTYDKTSRLTKDQIGSGGRNFTFDIFGNRETEQEIGGATETSTYDKNNRLLTSPSATYTYDNNGNRRTRNDTEYTYDVFNRLTKLSENNSFASVSSDALNRAGEVSENNALSESTNMPSKEAEIFSFASSEADAGYVDVDAQEIEIFVTDGYYPIAGAIVTLNGETLISNEDGKILFEDVSVSDDCYTVTVDAQDFGLCETELCVEDKIVDGAEAKIEFTVSYWTSEAEVPAELISEPVPMIRRGSANEFFMNKTGIDKKPLMNVMIAETDAPEVGKQWVTGANMAYSHVNHKVVAYDGKIYVIGGNNYIEIYDIAADAWSLGASSSLANAKGHTATLYNGKIYIIGGSGKKAVEIYDIETNTIASGTSCTIANYGHEAFEYEGKIYVVGGSVVSGGDNRKTRIYNILTNTWTIGATAKDSRTNGGAILYNGKIYCMGGDSAYNDYYRTYNGSGKMDIYDIATDKWTEGAALTSVSARGYFTATLYNGKIYVVGGHVKGSSSTNKDMRIYDIETNSWTNGTSMTKARRDHTAVEYEGNLYVYGGTGAIDSLEIYNFETNTWATGASKNVGEYGIAAVLYEGKIYAMGWDGTNSGNKLEIYTTYDEPPAAEPGDEGEIVYTYDGNGLMQTKTVDGITTRFVWDGANIVAEITGDNIITYSRGLRLISRDDGTAKDYYHHNPHGDVTTLTNSSGATIESFTYDAFGNQLTATGTNPFRYCGEYFDSSSGLIYLRARWYDSSTGRFLTEDPIKDGRNWYAYTGNNPIRFADPSGLVLAPANGGKVKEGNSSWSTMYASSGSGVKSSSSKAKRVSQGTSFDRAITVVEDEYGITIYAFLSIKGNAANKEIGDANITYRQAVIDGIMEYWSGYYNEKPVNVMIVDLEDGGDYSDVHPRQESVMFVINPGYGRPYAHDYYYGGNIGWVEIFQGQVGWGSHYTVDEFKRTAAHEFGHKLGIADLYNDDEIPTKFPSIMNDQFEVNGAQAVDYAMMFRAQEHNRWTYWNDNTEILDNMGIMWK